MFIKRRKDMNNQERVCRIINVLYKDKKYRRFLFGNQITMWIILFVMLILCTIELELFEMKEKHGINLGIISLVLFVVVVMVLYFGIKELQKKQMKKRIQIGANVNVQEIEIRPPSNHFIELGYYVFVAYYVKDLCTYRFKCIVRDDQWDLYSVMLRLIEDGTFPKIKVLVDPNKYKKYKVLGYEYIEDLLNENKEIVDEALDDCYNTSAKWKYIK